MENEAKKLKEANELFVLRVISSVKESSLYGNVSIEKHCCTCTYRTIDNANHLCCNAVGMLTEDAGIGRAFSDYRTHPLGGCGIYKKDDELKTDLHKADN